MTVTDFYEIFDSRHQWKSMIQMASDSNFARCRRFKTTDLLRKKNQVLTKVRWKTRSGSGGRYWIVPSWTMRLFHLTNASQPCLAARLTVSLTQFFIEFYHSTLLNALRTSHISQVSRAKMFIWYISLYSWILWSYMRLRCTLGCSHSQG